MFQMINAAILLVVLYLLFIQNRKFGLWRLYLAMGINAFLWLATVFTPLPELRWGAAIFYLLLSFLFCLDIKNIEGSKFIQLLFLSANLINVFLGFSIILEVQGVADFIKSNYAMFYDDLVPNMIFFHKPVLSFATHSLAGFFMYLFFYMNLQTYKTKNNVLYLLFSLIYICFLIFLKSNTALLFVGIATLQLFVYLFIFKKKMAYWMIFLSVLGCWYYNQEISSFLKVMSYNINQTLTSSTNGIQGRFSSTGSLRDNLNYLGDHPFRPIGFGYSSDLFYGDSGFIEYILRGSLLLAICIYTALFLFLKNNLFSKKTAYALFGLILLFEIGFTGLTYFRTLYLLPFMIIYLNFLEKQKTLPKKHEKKLKKKIKIKWAS